MIKIFVLAKKMELLKDHYKKLVKYCDFYWKEEKVIRLYASQESLTVKNVLGRGAFGVVYRCLDSDK